MTDKELLQQALEALETVFMPHHPAVIALREKLAGETEAEIYKRLYELRGKALDRPCSSCGYQPKRIYPMGEPARKEQST